MGVAHHLIQRRLDAAPLVGLRGVGNGLRRLLLDNHRVLRRQAAGSVRGGCRRL